MITFCNVNKKYKNNVIFENVNISIDGSGVYLVRGKSGIGKTTLLNMIANIVSYEGKIENDYINAMSYVFQNGYLIEHLSVGENLDLYGISHNFLSLYNLKGKESDKVSNLSKGERARVALIVALYRDGELVLIDEPITNLDENNARIVAKEILRCGKKKLIILVSHESKLFLKGLTGIIDIKDKRVSIKKFKKGNKLVEKKTSQRIGLKYIQKEWKWYKKDNIKLLMVNFIFVFIIGLINIASIFTNDMVSKDILYSQDYNKFYLSECRQMNEEGLSFKMCSNPTKESLEKLSSKGIKYGYNYDSFLFLVYSRDDLRVISNKNGILKEGKYPSKYSEVIASDKYKLGDIITLESNVSINDLYNDVYKQTLKVEVVGIYNNLKFLKDDNIYFDFDLTEGFFKGEVLTNNEYSLYDYYEKLDINEYKYIGFDCLGEVYLDPIGVKYEFYNTILNFKDELLTIMNNLNIFLCIGCGYLIIKFNKRKLVIKQKSNAFLIANSYPVWRSVFLSNILELSINFILLIVSSVLIPNIWICLYLVLSSLCTLIQTFYYYRKKNVSNLLRREL